jgi:hypothetical protein
MRCGSLPLYCKRNGMKNNKILQKKGKRYYLNREKRPTILEKGENVE